MMCDGTEFLFVLAIFDAILEVFQEVEVDFDVGKENVVDEDSSELVEIFSGKVGEEVHLGVLQ